MSSARKLPGKPRQQYLTARLLSRVQRGGWRPVKADPARLIRVWTPEKESPEPAGPYVPRAWLRPIEHEKEPA